MKRATKLSFLLVLGILFYSCFETDEFPVIPQIEFEDIRFVDIDGSDSLILSFSFQDGDGDIGINAAEDLPPFHSFDVIFDSNDSVVSLNSDNHVPPYSKIPLVFTTLQGVTNYFLFPEFEEVIGDEIERPPYGIFGCDYEIINEDTLLILRNEFNDNFHIEFLAKPPGASQFEVINFREGVSGADCTLGDFDGRIPFFDPDGNEGIITYAMLSQAFVLTFQDDSIKLRFYIYDRALNKSNTVETPGFVFSELL